MGKKEGDEKPRRKVKTSFGKRKGGGAKHKDVDASLKVWIGGLSPKTTVAKLKQHFVDNGCAADGADLMRKGTGVVTFKTEAEVNTAILGLNGTDLDGNTIEVDVWTKTEKKEKVKEEME